MKPIIAVTGSVGKTTTKEMIASVLAQRFQTFKSVRNLNLPEHIARYQQQIKPNHEAVVLEYAIANHGSIRTSCDYIQPNIGIITNIGTAHLSRFEDKIAGIVKAKSELVQGMHQDGLLFLNADDENSKQINTKIFHGQRYSIGIENNKADFIAHSIQCTRAGMSFQLQGENQIFFIPVWGRHNIYNALFAIGVGFKLGLSFAEIQQGLKSFEKPYSRLTHYRLPGIDVIDDTFNASPESMKAAIDVLSMIGKGNNVAILGDVSGLGEYSIEAHKEIGKYLASKNIHFLYTYGREAKLIGEGAIEAGFNPSHLIHCDEQLELHAQLQQHSILPLTTFLLKATARLNMQPTVEFFIKHCLTISKTFFKKIAVQ